MERWVDRQVDRGEKVDRERRERRRQAYYGYQTKTSKVFSEAVGTPHVLEQWCDGRNLLELQKHWMASGPYPKS